MQYLVDVGRLIAVVEVTPQAALELAIIDAGGREKVKIEHPLVYVMDRDRKRILEVIE